MSDADKAISLAYAYAVTGENTYARKAIEYALAWAETYLPNGNPINENKLTPLIAAYGIVKKMASSEEIRKIDYWLLKIGTATLKHDNPNEKGNWKSKRIKIVGLIGAILENDSFLEYSRKSVLNYIEDNFYSDSTTFDLRERDALNYHCGGIEPVLSILLLLKDTHPHLYSLENSHGGSVKNQ
ncbi:MAG: hypothetical protein HC905_30120 [Bacteroidales bacterium]|nr:hypothetical protein [Bacteroidales bacterium]